MARDRSKASRATPELVGTESPLGATAVSGYRLTEVTLGDAIAFLRTTVYYLLHGSGWRKLSGPLGTVLAFTIIELLRRFGVSTTPAPIIAVLLVLYAALRGGIISGVVTSAIVATYYTYYVFQTPGEYSRLFYVLAVITPAAALTPRFLRSWFGQVLLQGRRTDDENMRRAMFLSAANALLETSLGFHKTLEQIARLPIPVIADWAAVYSADEHGHTKRQVVWHPHPPSADALREALRRAPLTMNRPHPLAAVEEVVRSGRAKISNAPDYAYLGAYARTNQERLLLEDLTPHSFLMVPLVSRSRTIGALVLVFAGSGRRHSRGDQELAEEFCQRAAIAADSAQLFDLALEARSDAEASRERVVNILESITDGFIALDHEWRFSYVNGEAERLLGHERDTLSGQEIWRHFPRTVGSRFYQACHQAIRNDKPVRFEADIQWGQEKSWTEVHLFPSAAGLSVYFRDISARKEVEEALTRSEEQLRQSQKMEAVGRLAGGVAHDFNNILMAINGYTELMMARVKKGDEIRGDLVEVQKAAARASALTRQLLAFSRKQVHEPRALDLNAVVEQIEKMLRRIIGEDVVLVTKLQPDLGPVTADPGQMEQVIMNLVVNARDAMPTGGLLTIETDNVEYDGSLDLGQEGTPLGSFIVLSVTDTGCGMDEDTLSHIFEPFFTTKEKGKGTGLGLATVYGIVKQSGGHVRVDTRPGKGTRFEIALPRRTAAAREATAELVGATPQAAEAPAFLPANPPAVATPATAPPAASPAPSPAPTPRPITIPQGSGTILVAEDEVPVRGFVSKVLGNAGYTVLAGANGKEALAVAEQNRGTIDLLLTDVVMPEMGGRELAARMTAARPGIKIIFMSGYAEDEMAHHGILPPGTVFLEKPFPSDALLRKVWEMLDPEGYAAEFQRAAG